MLQYRQLKGATPKEKEILIMMYFYEIRNTKTYETCEVVAKDYATACKQRGWKPKDCRCVWKASVENGY